MVFLVALPVLIGAFLLAFTLYFLIPHGYTTQYHESYNPQVPGSGVYHPWTGSEAWSFWYMLLASSYMLIFIFLTNFIRTVRFVRVGDYNFRVIASIPHGSFEVLLGPRMSHRFIETPKRSVTYSSLGHESYDTIKIMLIQEALDQERTLMHRSFDAAFTSSREVKR